MISRDDPLILVPSNAEAERSGEVLTSWKDIAKFLGRGTRTVQRWEKEFGLPVRRPRRGKKSSVMALPSEINRWVCSQVVSNGIDQARDFDLAEMQLQVRALQAENAELRRQLRMLHTQSA